MSCSLVGPNSTELMRHFVQHCSSYTGFQVIWGLTIDLYHVTPVYNASPIPMDLYGLNPSMLARHWYHFFCHHLLYLRSPWPSSSVHATIEVCIFFCIKSEQSSVCSLFSIFNHYQLLYLFFVMFSCFFKIIFCSFCVVFLCFFSSATKWLVHKLTDGLVSWRNVLAYMLTL